MAIVILAIFSHFASENDVHELPYSSFIEMVERGHVISVTVKHINIEFESTKNENYRTIAPQAMTPPYLELLLKNKDSVKVTFLPLEDWPGWLQILFNLAPWVIIIGLWFYFISKMQSGSPRDAKET